jgi:hypothetical protein
MEPEVSGFTFIDESDMANFIVVSYLAVNTHMISYNDATSSLSIRWLSSFVGHEAWIATILRELLRISKDSWERCQYTSQELDILTGIIDLGNQRATTTDNASSEATTTPRCLAYGYFSEMRGMTLEDQAVIVSLSIGIDPYGVDRLGRTIDQCLTLTLPMWKCLIDRYDFSIGSTIVYNYTNEIVPILGDIANNLVQDFYQGCPMTTLFMTSDQLRGYLERDTRCHDVKRLNLMYGTILHHYQYAQRLDRENPNLPQLGHLERRQLLIFFEGLSRFRNLCLSTELHRAYHQRLTLRVGLELIDLPPSSNFIGGIVYQDARDRFERIQHRHHRDIDE